jgi:hypothetical protein
LRWNGFWGELEFGVIALKWVCKEFEVLGIINNLE